MPFTQYLKSLRENLRTGQAGELAHRPAFKSLLESLGGDIQALNEPTHVPFGAPDFLVKRGAAALGYVECKDLGANLDEIQRTEQFTRYLHGCANINFILTDYLEFRWYREAELCRAERLGRLTPDRSDVKRDSEGVVQVQKLLEGFFSAEPIAVGTAQELARYMAAKAKQLRDNAQRVLSQEGELGSLHALHQAFRETLIHDLDAEQFADMYAQTLAYGLFSSCFELRRREPGAEFDRFKAEHYVPRTNPFLRKVFDQIAGPELDRSLEWIANDIAELLNHADMSQIAADFARKPGREDPVVHFYEDFLRAYDPAKRKARGVYYTPEPVVSYIVRSIDYLLKEKFDKPLGLADENVYILDPACGTGTFLYFVIEQIHQNMQEAGLAGVWPDYVKNKLLKRIFGFELQMAPYTIAHMKLAIQLQDLGYDLSGDDRLEIYLTNTLEQAIELAEGQQMFPLERAIADEANAANNVKHEAPIMVVLGNPPYNARSRNKGPYITNLMERYKEAVHSEQNIQPLSNDYIKFVRFAHDRIERTGYGIVGMITDNSYLSGLIHRGVREELMKTFPEIYVIDLHGNSRSGETTPDGSKDENVFDIQEGVAISLMVRPDTDELPEPEVRHADLWGEREAKNERLASTDVSATDWAELSPQEPRFFFIPRDLAQQSEYEQGWSIADIFPVNSSGIKTHRDHFVIDFDRDSLQDRVADFRNPDLSYEQVKDQFGLCDTRDWKLSEARHILQTDPNWQAAFQEVLYRPFDTRWLCYHDAMLDWPRREVMQHMLEDNLALVATRQTRDPFAVLLISCLSDHKCMAAYDTNTILPLYLYPREGTTEQGRRPNLNPDFIKEFSEKLGLDFISDGRGDLGLEARATERKQQDSGTGFQPVTGEIRRTRRNLPHWEAGGATYFLTFRLKSGQLSLSERQIVLEACLFWQGTKWMVEAVVVMPDHVHLLARPQPSGTSGQATAPGRVEYYPLSEILHSIKSYTANQINQHRGSQGALWLDEHFDRIVRDGNEFAEKLEYMANNAVKAGLCQDYQEYPYFWYRRSEDSLEVGDLGLEAQATERKQQDSMDKENQNGGIGFQPVNRECQNSGTFGPEDIFYYAYAVFHSPTYRTRYAEFLKIDFPRLPLTSDKELFAALVAKGNRLADLHLMREKGQISDPPAFNIPGSNVVERVRYDDENERVYINKEQHFAGVEPEVWEFQIGGYQVCQKWLKDRTIKKLGRALSYDDITHYQKIVLALRETRQLMAEIDATIPAWPIE